VIVESFEFAIIQHIKAQKGVRLVQLLDALDTRPWDFVACGDPRTYREMITPSGLAEIASYAFAVGPWKRLIIPAAPSGAELVEPEAQVRLGQSTSLIRDAHAAGLQVHAWTFRNEARFLAGDYANDPHREYAQFFDLGLDGFITDFPDTAALALPRLGR
jgi:glycerophosphoryl diester phosphodiesterase